MHLFELTSKELAVILSISLPILIIGIILFAYQLKSSYTSTPLVCLAYVMIIVTATPAFLSAGMLTKPVCSECHSHISEQYCYKCGSETTNANKYREKPHLYCQYCFEPKNEIFKYCPNCGQENKER